MARVRFSYPLADIRAVQLRQSSVALESGPVAILLLFTPDRMPKVLGAAPTYDNAAEVEWLEWVILDFLAGLETGEGDRPPVPCVLIRV